MFHITNSISLHSKSLRALKQQFSKMAYSGNIKVPESSSSTPTTKAKAGHHRAQQIDQQSALQMSQKENNNIISFTLTFHPHNHAVKSIILKNFKLLQNADPDTGKISGIFTQPQLISFKRDKNIGNFLVSSAFKTSEQIKLELLNVHAHDVKHVLSFTTLRNCRNPSDQLRSGIILPVPQPMSSTV